MKPTMIVSLLAVLGAPAAHALAQVVNPHAAVQMTAWGSVITPDGSDEDSQSRDEPNLTTSWGDIILASAGVAGRDTSAGCLIQHEVLIDPTGYLLRLICAAYPQAMADPESTARARGDSRAAMTFTLSESHRIEWGGHVSAYNGSTARTWLRRVDVPGFEVFEYMASEGQVDFGPPAIVVPAGVYVLEAELLGTAEVVAGSLLAPADWEVMLIFSHVPTPCPGDANGDSMVNFTDITAILANFGHIDATGLGVGDSNHDGVVNFADVTETLVRFNQPCD